MIETDSLYIQGNYDVGFKEKPNFKEEKLEDLLNRKKQIDEKTRKNGFSVVVSGNN